MPSRAVEPRRRRRAVHAAAIAVTVAVALGTASPAAGAGGAASRADLRVEVTRGQDAVTAGNRLTYFAAVRNTGAAAAQRVELTIRLPRAVVPVVGTGETDRRCRGQRVLRCRLGTIATGGPDDTTLIEIVLRSTKRGRFTARMQASLRGRDARPRDNVRRIRMTVLAGRPSADLSASATTSDARVVAGQAFDYVVDVHNAGPTEATRVVVATILPAGAVQQGGGIAGNARYVGCGGGSEALVRCLIGALPPGESVRLTFRVAAGDAGERSFSSSVTTRTPDRDLGDRRTGAAVTVDPPPAVADLGVIVRGPVQGAVVGTPLAYQAEVTNAGPDAARGVAVALLVGGQGRLLSSTAPEGVRCSGTPVTCMLDELAPGATVTVSLLVEPLRQGTLFVGAYALSSVFDPSAYRLGGLPNSAFVETRVG